MLEQWEIISKVCRVSQQYRKQFELSISITQKKLNFYYEKKNNKEMLTVNWRISIVMLYIGSRNSCAIRADESTIKNTQRILTRIIFGR